LETSGPETAVATGGVSGGCGGVSPARIRHITSFACFSDADYVRRYGELVFLDEYGCILQGG
jgi:hypothetical protein